MRSLARGNFFAMDLASKSINKGSSSIGVSSPRKLINTCVVEIAVRQKINKQQITTDKYSKRYNNLLHNRVLQRQFLECADVSSFSFCCCNKNINNIKKQFNDDPTPRTPHHMWSQNLLNICSPFFSKCCRFYRTVFGILCTPVSQYI